MTASKLTKTLLGIVAIIFGLVGVLIMSSAFVDFSEKGVLKWLASDKAESVIADDNPDEVAKELSELTDLLADSTALARQMKFKQLLIEKLRAEAWTDDDLGLMRRYLDDDRAIFQKKVLHINVGHVETGDQYAHHTNPESLELCRKFWAENREKINTAAKPYGVPGEVIAGILKVETNFGTWMGKHEVFNVFWSLALGDQPEVLATIEPDSAVDDATRTKKLKKKASWARKELKQLLNISRVNKIDPLEIKGSWAGAFGLAQFIPSSYNAYAKDGNDDGVVNLDNLDDAAASIANYLKKNGWRSDGNRNRMKKVVMRYNHSENYANCVLKLSDFIGKL